MKFAVIVFPGSNCDQDAFHAIRDDLGQDVQYVWHKETSLEGFDCVVLPGGFSYGDYLRAGAIARFSPIMSAVERFADRGGPVIGICNGFQVLTEAGLLPGALKRNSNLEFRCQWVNVRVESLGTPFTHECLRGSVLKLPIAHGEGSYYADKQTLQDLIRYGQIVLRYTDECGRTTTEANPNGSIDNIAGICNRAGNVFGLMPHPERASNERVGGTDGLHILRSAVSSLGITVAPTPFVAPATERIPEL